MSIREEILNRVVDGQLLKLSATLSSDPNLRSMYLTSELHGEVYRDRDDIKETKRFAILTADLEVFITNETIDPGYLWLLQPKKDGV